MTLSLTHDSCLDDGYHGDSLRFTRVLGGEGLGATSTYVDFFGMIVTHYLAFFERFAFFSRFASCEFSNASVILRFLLRCVDRLVGSDFLFSSCTFQVRLANHQRMLASPLHDTLLLEDAALTSSCEAILMDKPAADTVRFEAPVRRRFGVTWVVPYGRVLEVA